MCPDWESNWQPFSLQDDTKPIEPHQLGHFQWPLTRVIPNSNSEPQMSLITSSKKVFDSMYVYQLLPQDSALYTERDGEKLVFEALKHHLNISQENKWLIDLYFTYLYNKYSECLQSANVLF